MSSSEDSSEDTLGCMHAFNKIQQEAYLKEVAEDNQGTYKQYWPFFKTGLSFPG